MVGEPENGGEKVMLSCDKRDEEPVVDLAGGELLIGSGFEDEPEDEPEVAPAAERGRGAIPSADVLAQIGSLHCFQDVDADKSS